MAYDLQAARLAVNIPSLSADAEYVIQDSGYV